jgi:hypothetical protein
MTTAYQTTRTGAPAGQTFGGPFDFGSGHVDASKALDPGLIIDSDAPDWQRFMCGIAEVQYSDWAKHAECGPCLSAVGNADCVPSKYEAMTAAQVSQCVACDPSNFNTPSSEYATLQPWQGSQGLINLCAVVMVACSRHAAHADPEGPLCAGAWNVCRNVAPCLRCIILNK